MEGVEIERKFLLKRLPEELLTGARVRTIRQGYLIVEPDRELRIRQIDQEFWMTFKGGSGLERSERECRLTAEQFAFLWSLTAGKQIEKERHLVDWQGYRLEIDLFGGSLAPLVLLEVEFASRAESGEFEPPDFAAREVTSEPGYKNASLAIHGVPPTNPLEEDGGL